MKVTKTVEVEVCDLCEIEETTSSRICLGCGKHICWDCREKFCKEYSSEVFMSGGEGLYCNACDKLLITSADPVHTAYRVIESLRNEYTGWDENFSRRSKKAQENLTRVIEERRQSRG